ncbi:MAG: peptidase C25 [Thermoplasmatales archaeon]|nr:peptidase C25 [Thermoplasmatales archaeon]
MKKIASLIIVFIMVLGGLTTVATKIDNIENEQLEITTEKMKIQIPSPKHVVDNNYARLYFEDEELYLMETNEPMLPRILKIIELPFGAQNIEVKVNPNRVEEQVLSEEILPAPALLPLSHITNSVYIPEQDESTEIKHDLFPSTWYDYTVGCGLNADFEHVTFLSINILPVRYNSLESKIYVADSVDITINYENPNRTPFPLTSEYDLVVIAPSKFSNELERLVNHKNDYNVKTFLKTTEEIYETYQGRDKPEQIKYFIKDAIETWNITYVLLVGGLNSAIWAKPRDDCNQGSRDWHVPVRYTNFFDNPKFPLSAGSSIHDPGVISDLYYADIYKIVENETVFEDWDSNGDGIFLAWGRPGIENDTGIDFYPDVCLGRLACVNTREVRTVVDKIINYEKQPCDPSWFKKMVVVSGDGFLDQQDLDIQWDTADLPDGEYTIQAQSTNKDGISGPVDIIKVTLDKNVETNLSFNHDDHLKPELSDGYPALPIVEIVTVSNGDILGNTNYARTPGEDEAYCNDFNPWANMSYIDGVLTIRGKSYDPQAYGDITHIHLWITNDNEDVVFSTYRNNTEMYYEGEWTTGDKALLGRGGGLYYMPDDFEKVILWTSNGGLTGESDVINALDEGCGFLFFSGHGSPAIWGDQKPGIPGNRQHSWVTGLHVSNIGPTPPFITKLPVFPMNKLKNGEKLPIVVVGGCHNSQFNVSLIPAMIDILPYIIKGFPSYHLWTYGTGVPETFSWHIISRPNGGAIATMGNTGLGYGMPGKECTSGGGDSWITIEFFKQYGTEKQEVLGGAYKETLNSYINTFDMTDLEAGHPKTVQQWVLLGDPSLKIGGYS